MRRVPLLSLLAVFVASAIGFASPPEVPATLKVKPGQLVRVVVKADAGKLGSAKNFKDEEAFFGELVSPPGQRQFVFQAPTDGKRVQFVISWWTAGELDGTTTTIEIEGVAPDPDPKPVPPKPVPPGPDPDTTPVTSFRAILVYESGQTLTAAQNGVLYGVALQVALDTAIGGSAGTDPKFAWRRLDKDANPATLPVGLREMWTAAQKSIKESGSQLPVIAIQVNDTITIEPLPTTGQEAADLVKKYRRK